MINILLLMLSISENCTNLPCSTSINFSITVIESSTVSANMQEIEPDSGIYKLVIDFKTNFNLDKIQESYLVIKEDKKELNEMVAMINIEHNGIQYYFYDSIVVFKWDEGSAKTAIALNKRKTNESIILVRSIKNKNKIKNLKRHVTENI